MQAPVTIVSGSRSHKLNRCFRKRFEESLCIWYYW